MLAGDLRARVTSCSQEIPKENIYLKCLISAGGQDTNYKSLFSSYSIQ